MNIQSWVSCLLVGTLIQSGLFAQSDDTRKAARAEVHQYISEQIAPVMKVQRTKLDTYLSPEEQTQLSEIRSELKALKAEKEASGFTRKGRKHHQEGQTPPTPEQREEFQQMRAKMHAQMEEARSILETHKDEIKTLLEEIAPEREQWKTDIGTIKEKHMGEREEKDRPSRRHHGHHRARPDSAQDHLRPPHPPEHRGKGRHGMVGFARPMGFLLWNGELPASSEQDDELNLNIYPNPTRSESNIRYEVKKAGKVTVTLLNDQGAVIKTLTNETKTPGTYAEHVQHDRLKPGVYIYRVETASGTETGKLLIE